MHDRRKRAGSSRRRVAELLAGGRPVARARQPLPARVLRRPAPAHRHRPRARPRARRSSCCDEPVSALDVSIQAQVVNLLEDLQDRARPDLPVHRPRPVGGAPHLDRVAVMYLGKIVEMGTGRRDLRAPAAPLHPGAAVGRARARSRPWSGPRARILLEGDVPSPIDPPSGCRFRTRCPKAHGALRRGRAGAGRPGPGHRTRSPATSPRSST